MEEYKPEIFNRDGLSSLGIYELRELARDLGVVSPTSKEKQSLIEEILQIIYGENYDSLENLTKGRPTKHKKETDWLNVFGKEGQREVFYGKLDRNFQGAYSFVATPTLAYENDAKKGESENGEEIGVVYNENYQFVIKSFKSTGYGRALPLPYEFIEKYKLTVGDVVKYRLEKGKVVEILDIEKMTK